MNTYQERFRTILERYREELQKVGKGRKRFSGIFGIGAGPGDDPCHTMMDQQVEKLTAEMAEGETTPDETAALVSDILKAEKTCEWTPASKWAVIAVQRHALPLIPKMNPEGRKELADWYVKAYPRRERLPIQKDIIQELSK